MNSIRLAILGGAGKMGLALIRGLTAAGKVAPSHITATAQRQQSLDRLKEWDVGATLDNAMAVRGAEVVILAVHPGDISAALGETRDVFGTQQLVISIVTGVSTTQIEAQLPDGVPVVRAMPNIGAVVGESTTVVCAGRHAQPSHLELARDLFGTIGLVEQLDEKHLNAATGLGGCGPAFVFKIIEAMSEGGVKMGLPREVARQMAAQVVKGAAALVLQTGSHPAELKDAVTTPGGCTIDGIAKLQERGIAIALIDAVEVSTRKASLLFEAPKKE